MTSRQNKARSKKKTTANAVVFCCPAASAAMPPRRQSAAVLPSLAPHDSKARLRVVTTRRRFMAKPCTPHLHCAARAVLQDQGWQCNLSLGGSRGIFSFEKENIPLDSCSAVGAAILPLAWNAKHKKRGPCFRTAPFLCRLAAAAVIAATAIVAAAATAAAAAGEDQDDEDQDPQAAAAAKTTVIIAHKTNPL